MSSLTVRMRWLICEALARPLLAGARRAARSEGEEGDAALL